MYTILVGRPGVGKGGAVNPAVEVLRKAGTVNVLSDKLTIEYVLEKLSKGFTSALGTSTGGITFGTDSASMLFCPELSVFISNPDNLGILCDLWDARTGVFDYGTRGKGLFTINSPCQSMLAGSAPEWLIKAVPQTAIGGGFTRRVNFIHAKQKGREIPFPTPRNGTSIEDKLIEDLRWIHSNLRGVFKLCKETESEFEKFYLSCKAAEFDDEATASYTTSKWVHALKLSMVISASKGDSLEVTLLDFQEAVDQVEQIAKDIKMVFRGVGSSDLTTACDKALKVIELKGYATRKQIMSLCWQYCTTFEMEVVLKTLEDSDLILVTQQGPTTLYRSK